MKIKKTFVLVAGLLLLPLQCIAQNTSENDSQTRADLNNRSQLKICFNETTDKFYVSGRCKSGARRLEYVDFRASSFGLIPSGVTVLGVVGGHYTANAASNAFNVIESLQSQTAQVFDSENDIQVVNTSAVDSECSGLTCLNNTESSNESRCLGTSQNPTAPAGVVCIYPTTNINAQLITGYNIVDSIDGNSATPITGGVGFGIGWQSLQAGTSALEAVWAYQAP
jgi:hypothetical protein